MLKEKDFVTPHEFAEIFRVNIQTVWKYLREGKIEFIEVFNKKLIPKAEVERFTRKGN